MAVTTHKKGRVIFTRPFFVILDFLSECLDPFDDADSVESAASDILDFIGAKRPVIDFYVVDHGVQILAILTGTDQYGPVS